MVQIGHPSDAEADLDLYLFNCTRDTAVAERKGFGRSANKVIFVEHPAAGLWKVVVDAFSVPSGSTTYEYLDSALLVLPTSSDIMPVARNGPRQRTYGSPMLQALVEFHAGCSPYRATL